MILLQRRKCFGSISIPACFDGLHEKFGEVMSVNVGPSPRIVVIGDYYILKEVLKDDRSTGRPPNFTWFNQEFRFGNGQESRGLVFSLVLNCLMSVLIQLTVFQNRFLNP